MSSNPRIEPLRQCLERLAKGEISVDEAEKLVKLSAIEELEKFAKLDINRDLRKGVPEIVLGEGKSPRELVKIIVKILESRGRVICSRTSPEQLEALLANKPAHSEVEVKAGGRLAIAKMRGVEPTVSGGVVGVLTAGTSDIPVAEEVEAVAREMGCKVVSAYDVGVAGIQRVFPAVKKMLEEDADVLVVVAGMEGALPSVVAGLVDIPVIAVPTSFGYGLGGKGLAALMAMLQACPLGISVVNIDGGVAAGTVAALIALRAARRSSTR